MTRYLKMFVLLAGLLLPVSGRAAIASETFYKVWDSSDRQLPIYGVTALAWDETGKYLYAAYQSSDCGLGVAKVSGTGSLIWRREETGGCGTGSWQAKDVAFDADGNVYVTGMKTTGTGNGAAEELFVRKFLASDGSQDPNWSHMEYGYSSNRGNAIAVHGTDIYVGGAKDGKFFIFRLSVSDSVAHWATTYSGSYLGSDSQLLDLAVDDSGTVYMVNRSIGGYWQFSKLHVNQDNSWWKYISPNNSSNTMGGTEKAKLIKYDDGSHGMLLIAAVSSGSAIGTDIIKVNPTDLNFPLKVTTVDGQVADMVADPSGNLVYAWQPTQATSLTSTTTGYRITRYLCVTNSNAARPCGVDLLEAADVSAVAAGTVEGVNYIFVGGSGTGLQALAQTAGINSPAVGSIQIRKNVINIKNGDKALILLRATGSSFSTLKVFTISGAYVGEIPASNVDSRDGLVEFDGKIDGKALTTGVYWITAYAASGEFKDRKRIMVLNEK